MDSRSWGFNFKAGWKPTYVVPYMQEKNIIGFVACEEGLPSSEDSRWSAHIVPDGQPSIQIPVGSTIELFSKEQAMQQVEAAIQARGW